MQWFPPTQKKKFISHIVYVTCFMHLKRIISLLLNLLLSILSSIANFGQLAVVRVRVWGGAGGY